MDAKLLSYNTEDYPTKAHMEMKIIEFEKNIEKYSEPMRKAGLVSFTVTQVWNKQGKFRIGTYYAYRDEKAFIECQKILNGIPQDEENAAITTADRGVVRLRWDSRD